MALELPNKGDTMFRKTTITIDRAEVKGYAVDGLDPRVYRGLQVVFSRLQWQAVLTHHF